MRVLVRLSTADGAPGISLDVLAPCAFKRAKKIGPKETHEEWFIVDRRGVVLYLARTATARRVGWVWEENADITCDAISRRGGWQEVPEALFDRFLRELREEASKIIVVL